jgi:hypothetical protein
LDLSPVAIVGLINGLFGESFPLQESEVIRTATESVSDDLGQHIFSDKMITIKTDGVSRRYHIEAEITSEDKEIVVRVFEYGYRDALKYRIIGEDNIVLNFPQPKIIYLEHWNTAPDEVTLELNFWGQSKAQFTVPTMKFLDYSIQELNERHMVILLPLYLLKLRRKIENAKSKGPESIKQYAPALKALLNDDILGTIEKNVDSGNITHGDANTLLNLLDLLYNHLYGSIAEFQAEGVNDMLDDKLIFRDDRKVLETKEEIARNFLAKGISPEDVADATKLSIERVKKLQQQEAHAV